MDLSLWRWSEHDKGDSLTKERKWKKKKSLSFYGFNRTNLACCLLVSLWKKPLVFIISLGSLEVHRSTIGKKFTQIGGVFTLLLSVKEERIKKKEALVGIKIRTLMEKALKGGVHISQEARYRSFSLPSFTKVLWIIVDTLFYEADSLVHLNDLKESTKGYDKHMHVFASCLSWWQMALIPRVK